MKNIGAVIASEKVGMVVNALKKIGVGGFTVLDAKGRGKGKRSQLQDHEALVATQQNLTQKLCFHSSLMILWLIR